jgi:hypothetical protein
MQYMRSFQFIMDRKNWMMNILMGGVCFLIPIIGPLVFLGWMYEVIESLHRDPEHRDYADFDFNRFSEYLSRGIWPFLVQLIVGAILAVPIMIMYVLMFVVVLAAAKDAPVLILFFYLLFMIVVIVLTIGSALISWPAGLYTGLNRGFNFGAIVAFVKDFSRRMLKETLLSMLFLMVAGLILGPLGFLLFCVGIYFVQAAISMSQHHLQFQLYELYLQRGGSPIPMPGTAKAPAAAEPIPGDEPDERFRAAP